MDNGIYRPDFSQPPGGGRFSLGGRMQKELDWFRTHDSFVGLPNVVMLQRHFAQLTSRSHWAFALIHINRFIRLNSIFGLDLGGKTLQRLSPILSEFAELAGGHAYRISLGRLAVLIPAPDRDAFRVKLEDVLLRMEEVRVEDEHIVYSYHYTFTYSAYFLSDNPQDYQNVDALLTFTDLTARSKRDNSPTGGNVYDFQTRPKWAGGELPLPDVRQAWEREEFEPAYQPVYDLKTGKPVGAELLLRWRHPELGMIPPSDFLPLIESEGLTMDMDLYMLEAACKKIKKWIGDELVTIPLSINICRQNIHRADFLPRLLEIVMSYDVPPVLLELELNETALIFENSSFFLYLMDQLHRMGFTLTMDACAASNFSSVGLLRDLPIDKVKISPNFLRGVSDSERDRIYVSNLLRLAQELGIQTVATEIETQEQMSTWMNLGCYTGQGFFLSRPLFNDDFEALIF